MSHTEEFNKIMARVNAEHKAKKADKKAKKATAPELIGGGDGLNPLQQSIAKCRILGDTVFLPSIQEGVLENYAEVRKAFLGCGAVYNKNKFVFPNDARQYVDRLMNGDSVNLKKEFQFYATPTDLAEEMASFLDCSNPFMKVLEPSAGHGALIKAVVDRWALNYPVDYCELMDINRAILGKNFANCAQEVGTDFISLELGQYDRIIANPPFSKNQDIDHVRKMWSHLKSGGRIVTVTSKHWQFSQGKKEVEFREWIDEIGATVDDIEAGTFSKSGTNIPTVLIIIDKL